MSSENHVMLSSVSVSDVLEILVTPLNCNIISLAISCAQGEERLVTTNSPLAFLKKELGGSHNLAKASRTASRRFFTKRLNPPRGWIGMSPQLEKSLLKKYNDSVETWF